MDTKWFSIDSYISNFDYCKHSYNMINGFTRRWHPYQFGSYLIFLEVSINIYLVIHDVSDLLRILSTVLFTLCLMFTIYYAFMATFIDPTDDFVIRTKKGKLAQ